jgi:hypothetical protein
MNDSRQAGQGIEQESRIPTDAEIEERAVSYYKPSWSVEHRERFHDAYCKLHHFLKGLEQRLS